MRDLADDLLRLLGRVVAPDNRRPCSLTMRLCWKDVIGPVSLGTTVDASALGCQDGSAMIA